jgi:hypothetical protein
MMQAAESRKGNDPRIGNSAIRRNSAFRSFLFQAEVRSVAVIVADVLAQQAFQMKLVEHDRMIKQVPSAASYESLGHAVLPGTLKGSPLRNDAEAPDRIDNFRAEIRSAVEDQILRSQVKWKCFAQLLDHPCTSRVSGRIAVKDAATIMRNDKEAIQHTEGEGGDREEIHRRDHLTMIAQKCRPSLCRLEITRRFPHPTQDGSLRYREAEHLQFTMNARRTPRFCFRRPCEKSGRAVPCSRTSCRPEPCAARARSNTT